MEVVTALIAQGGFGIVAALAFWLFITERKEHREDNKTWQTLISELQNARLTDQKDTSKDFSEVLQGNSQAMRVLTEKIEIAKTKGAN